MDIKKIIFKFTLHNAVKYEKADFGAVVGKVFAELKTGETKQVDINIDGKNDLNVKLVNIYNGMAEVLVKEIIAEKKEEVKEEAKTEEKKGLEEVTGSAVSKGNIRNYAIGATLLLLAGIFVVLVVRIVKKIAQ